MRARFKTLVTIGMAVALASCRADPVAPSKPAADAVAAAALSAFGARQLPGMSVVVLEGDTVLLSRSYGYADLNSRQPVDDGTIFQLGSISKQFLAAVVVLLATEGKLSLDDPIVEHVSGLAHVPATVRVRHLLSHTSGIRELFQLPGALEAFDDLSRTRAELMAAVRRAPLDFAPAARWSYSNTNYTLLAALVEHVAGRPYEDVIVERLLAPLGLRSLRQCRSVPQGPSEAVGYVWDGTTNVPAAPENMEWIRGDGGFCGTAGDVARWTSLLASGKVVPPEQYAVMARPTRLDSGQDVDYGFALSLVRPDGLAKVSHGGAMRGYSGQASYYPDRRVAIAVLTNRGDVRADAIERAIARATLGRPAPVHAEVPLALADRGYFVGQFDIGVFTIRVEDRQGRLWLVTPPPGPTTPLRHIGESTFVSDIEPDGTELRFSADRNAVRLYMGAMHWYGRRQ